MSPAVTLLITLNFSACGRTSLDHFILPLASAPFFLSLLFDPEDSGDDYSTETSGPLKITRH
jgi:hypothetical protein